jgi:hypothetical protein
MATARCAACRIPIGTGQFKIDREFVFHPGCVGRPVLIEAELAGAREAAAQCSSVINDLGAKRSELRARAEKAEAEHRTAKLAFDNVTAELAGARARAELLERDLAALKAELAAAKAAVAATPDPATGSDDLHDASSIRFGLLELK